MEEVWKAINGFDKYFISNLGRIKSFKRYEDGRILKDCVNSRGYYGIELFKDDKGTRFLVHRLVGFAFIPNPDNLPQINHKDGIKTNNNTDNLEWCTSSFNNKHALLNGLSIPKKGSLNGRAKLKETDILLIRHFLGLGATLTEISSMFKVSPSTISLIKLNKTWKHIY